MLLTLKRACSCTFQYLKLSSIALPQMPETFVRSPIPGVNHLPMATDACGFERKLLNGLLERSIPCSADAYTADHCTPPCTNQLLQNEFVATLYFSVASVSCAIEVKETLATASIINNFFITFI